MLYQLAIGDFRKPISPGWEAGIEDPLIREDIADAACGDPGRRLASGAAELAERLLALDRRHAESDHLEQKRRGANRLPNAGGRKRAPAVPG